MQKGKHANGREREGGEKAGSTGARRECGTSEKKRKKMCGGGEGEGGGVRMQIRCPAGEREGLRDGRTTDGSGEERRTVRERSSRGHGDATPLFAVATQSFAPAALDPPPPPSPLPLLSCRLSHPSASCRPFACLRYSCCDGLVAADLVGRRVVINNRHEARLLLLRQNDADDQSVQTESPAREERASKSAYDVKQQQAACISALGGDLLTLRK